MFNVACIIFLLIIIYSLFYQIREAILYYQNQKKKTSPDTSGLDVAKDLLKNGKLNTLYVTKLNQSYKDHYDIRRNVIRLSKDVYGEANLNSIAVASFQVTKAIYINDINNRKKSLLLEQLTDYINKVCFVLFILATTMQDLSLMLLSLGMLLAVIIYKVSQFNTKIDIINKNINYIKKNYSLREQEIDLIEKQSKVMLLNYLSLHLINNKY